MKHPCTPVRFMSGMKAEERRETLTETKWNSPRICVMCGLKYIPLVARQLTCGQICSREYKLEHERRKYRSVSPKACVVCKAVFEADRKAKTCSKTCSDEWRKKNRRSPKKYPPKDCVICGIEFYGVPRAMTCSAECSYQSKLKRAREGLYVKDRPPKPCETCGEMFKPKSLSHRFCGRNCWESNPRKPAEIVQCLHCGEEYTKTKSHQKYCCIDCFEEAKKLRAQKTNWKVRGQPKKKIVKCKSCNFNFEQKHSRHVYCSASCNCDAQRERGRKATDRSPIRPKTCLHCEEKFTPRTRKSMAKFCSPVCRGGYQTAKKQEKIHEFERQQKNEVELQKKWDDSSIQVKDCPADSAYSKEIWQYLKQGKTITKYLHPIWAAGSVVDEDETELFDL